jgi:hypothetical protein
MAAGVKKGDVVLPHRLFVSGWTNSEGRSVAHLPLDDCDSVHVHLGLAFAVVRRAVDDLLGAVRTDLDDVEH